MTPEPYMIYVAVIVALGVAILAVDAWMRRRKILSDEPDPLLAWLKNSRCGRCRRRTTPWPTDVDTLCVDCAIAEMERSGRDA